MQSPENKNSFTGQEGGSHGRGSPENVDLSCPRAQRKDFTMETQGSGFPPLQPIELEKLPLPFAHILSLPTR